MTVNELIELLKRYPKDMTVLQTFVSKKKKVLASETSVIRMKHHDGVDYVELIHC